MTYINFNQFRKLKLTEEFVFFLLSVKSEDEFYINNYKEKEKALEENYIKQIKSGDYRLDKKGKDVLNKLSKSDAITPETEKLAEWIANYYKNKKGGIVRNKAELKRRLQWYCDETGIYKRSIAVLIACFINDTYDPSLGLSIEEFKEQNPRMQLSMLAENLVFTPRNHFARHYNLDDSPLHQYYLDNQQYIEEEWKKNGIEI